eukprot:jgi/Botrbrau1/913/Bobra.0167s0028.1
MKGHIRKGRAPLRDKPASRHGTAPCRSQQNKLALCSFAAACGPPPRSSGNTHPPPFQHTENCTSNSIAKAGGPARATTAPTSLFVVPDERPWTANLAPFTAAQLASCWSVEYPLSNGDDFPAWRSARGSPSRPTTQGSSRSPHLFGGPSRPTTRGSCRYQDVAPAHFQETVLELPLWELESLNTRDLKLKSAHIILCSFRAWQQRRWFVRYYELRRKCQMQLALLLLEIWNTAAQERRFKRALPLWRSLRAWRDFARTSNMFFTKVADGMCRSFMDSVAHLPGRQFVRLCIPPPWRCIPASRDPLRLSKVIANLLKRHFPRATQQKAFRMWRRTAREALERRQNFCHKIDALICQPERERAIYLIRFWHLWARQMRRERAGHAEEDPEPAEWCRPCPDWLPWAWRRVTKARAIHHLHNIRKERMLQICFSQFRYNRQEYGRYRHARAIVALNHQRMRLQLALHAFQLNVVRRNVERSELQKAFAAWQAHTSCEGHLRLLYVKLESTVARGLLATCLEAWRQSTSDAHVLKTAQTIRVWNSRALALASLHAWRHEMPHMWFFFAWRAWRGYVSRRLQFSLFVARISTLPELYWLRCSLVCWRHHVRMVRRPRVSGPYLYLHVGDPWRFDEECELSSALHGSYHLRERLASVQRVVTPRDGTHIFLTRAGPTVLSAVSRQLWPHRHASRGELAVRDPCHVLWKSIASLLLAYRCKKFREVVGLRDGNRHRYAVGRAHDILDEFFPIFAASPSSGCVSTFTMSYFLSCR